MSHFEQYGFMPTFFSQIPCVNVIWVTSSTYTHSSCKSGHGIMMLFVWNTFHWMSGCTSWSKQMNALPIKSCLKTRKLALPSLSCMWSDQLLCPALYQESYTVNFEQPTFAHPLLEQLLSLLKLLPNHYTLHVLEELHLGKQSLVHGYNILCS